jgi:hypothetical protein
LQLSTKPLQVNYYTLKNTFIALQLDSIYQECADTSILLLNPATKHCIPYV